MTDAEPTFMRDSIRSAIENHLAGTGGGFVHSFVYAAKATDAAGHQVMYLGGPTEQDTVDSLGLADYLVKWFDEEARELIAHSKHCSDDCGEDDE